MTVPTPLQTLSALRAQADIRMMSGTPRVVPVIIVRAPGTGAIAHLRDMAEDADVECYDIRCSLLGDDFRPLPMLVNGEVTYTPTTVKWLQTRFGRGREMMLILDDAASGSEMTTSAILAQAAAQTTGTVYAMMVVTAQEVDKTLSIIAEGLGMLPCEVHVHRLVRQSDIFRDAVAYARANGVAADVVDFLDARGDTVGLGMQAWIRYGAVLSNDAMKEFEPRTMETIARGLIGDEAYEAQQQWLAAQRALFDAHMRDQQA